MQIIRPARRDDTAGTTRRQRPVLSMALCAALALVPLLSLNQPAAGATSANDGLVTIQATHTSTSLTSSGPGYIGQAILSQLVGLPSIQFTAAVKSVGGGIPTGSVEFDEYGSGGQVTLGTCSLDGNGQATFNWYGPVTCGNNFNLAPTISGLNASSLFSQGQFNPSSVNVSSLLTQASLNLAGRNLSTLLTQAALGSLYGPSVGNHLIQARYLPDTSSLAGSQSAYIIQGVRTCSTTALLPVNNQLGLFARLTNGTIPTSSMQFRDGSAGFTVNNAQVAACFNPDPSFGISVAVGTVASRVGGTLPTNIPNYINLTGQPQIGDLTLLILVRINNDFGGLIGTASFNNIFNLNLNNVWADLFFPPYNSPASVSITTP
jgi:hypothetical protein